MDRDAHYFWPILKSIDILDEYNLREISNHQNSNLGVRFSKKKTQKKVKINNEY